VLPRCLAGRNAANFTVGLSNVHPLITNPQPGNYDVCGQYPGIVPRGATVKLTCDDPDLPPARYVIVRFPTTQRVIVCEVEVYTHEGWNHVEETCLKPSLSEYFVKKNYFSLSVHNALCLCGVWSVARGRACVRVSVFEAKYLGYYGQL